MIFVIKVYIDWLKKPFITEKYDFFTYLKIQRDVYELAKEIFMDLHLFLKIEGNTVQFEKENCAD